MGKKSRLKKERRQENARQRAEDLQQEIVAITKRLEEDRVWYETRAATITSHERELLNARMVEDVGFPDPEAYSTAFALASLIDGLMLALSLTHETIAYKKMSVTELLDLDKWLLDNPNSIELMPHAPSGEPFRGWP